MSFNTSDLSIEYAFTEEERTVIGNWEGAFHRMARVVTVRHLQRTFALEWDIEGDGPSEADLLKRYVSEFGAISRAPVLLTSDYVPYSGDAPLQAGSHLPWAVYYPERAIAKCFIEGKLDFESIENDEGFTPLDEGSSDRVVEITPRSMVSADTTLLDFLRTPSPGFERSGALVLQGTSFSGVFGPDDLMSAPARLCLFALILELETAAAELCRLHGWECIKRLQKQEREKAIGLLRARLKREGTDPSLPKHVERVFLLTGGSETDEDKLMKAAAASWLIDSTYLDDKGRMICDRKLLLINDDDYEVVERVFTRAVRLRNRCAHPGMGSETLPFSFAELREFVNDAIHVINCLQEAFKTEARPRKVMPS